MEYWNGPMDWPIDSDWVCEICGDYNGLTWGFVHGECRCDTCHAEYYMRDSDKDRTPLKKPKCLIKETFMEPAKKFYQENHCSLNKASKVDWLKFGVPENEFQEVKE